MNVVEPIKSKNDIKRVEEILKKENTRNYLLFIFGTNSGLRISDILGLDIKDVRGLDFVSIREKKTGKHKRFPINDKLKKTLKEFTKKKNDNEPLFQTIFHNRLERVQSYRIINNACRKVGLTERIGTHTLRKTFGYHHYKKFKDVVILQKIFNHTSPDTTLRYIGITQEEIDNSYKNFIL